MYGTITPYGRIFQSIPLRLFHQDRGPTTPMMPKQYGFGLFPGRSPLLGESLLFSSPRGNEMFQFPRFAYLTVWYIFNIPGCPIRISADQGSFAPTRSFSQLITSFFACESLGIHRTLLFASRFHFLLISTGLFQ